MNPSPLLLDLAAELNALWASPEQERRRRLWADHFNGRTRQVPVTCAMFQGWQDLVWQQILPEETFGHKDGLARVIEVHLRHHLWRAAHIPDDTPHNPALVLGALPPMAPDELWGVPLAFDSTGIAGGAYKPRPPLADPADIKKLRPPQFRYDEDAIRRQTEQVRDLIGDVLPLVFRCDALHNGPFEWAVRLRGMDNLLLDCYDRPEWLHELMGFLSRAMVDYHRARAAAGFVHSPTESALHSPWDDYNAPSRAVPYSPSPRVERRPGGEAPSSFPPSLRGKGGRGDRKPSPFPPSLRGKGGRGDRKPSPFPPSPRVERGSGGEVSWGYLHAQSAASYGPKTYAEFVQPYNVPIAELYSRVYYHGCEDLTQKVEIIRDLPNLREFHVSPWSQVAPIAAALPDNVVMEVHSHPTNVLFIWDEAQMREELKGLIDGAGDHPLNLKLCDIQTINADGGEALVSWSRAATELVSDRR